MEFTAKQIAAFLSGEIEGNPDVSVCNFSKIEEGEAGTLTFLANPKYTQYIYTTKASVVLVNKEFTAESPISATLIRVNNAYQCLAQLLQLVSQAKPSKSGIHAQTSIASTAVLGESLYIGAFVVIGENSRIGNNTKLYPQVFIGDNVKIGQNCTLYAGVKICDDCVVGENCIVQPGAVIGADGFGFAPQSEGDYQKIPQIGNVVIEDNVEIGANTTIDRATMGSTIVRKGVKLDNLIQIAHNVEIGTNTVIAAQSGVAGSSKIGANCMFGGQTGVTGHLHVADGAKVGAKTGITSSLTDASSPVFGTPAIPHLKYARSYAIFKKLPELSQEISAIRKDIDSILNSQK